MSDELYLAADGEAGDVNGEKAALVLEDIAETLRQAPDGKRYDVSIEVHEHE